MRRIGCSRRAFLLGAGALAASACRSGPAPVEAASAREAQRRPGPAPLAWDPARTWLFFAGLLEFQHADVFGSFPQAGRRDVELHGRLVARGVPPAQCVFLRDGDATLAHLRGALAAHVAAVPPGDTLWLYYAGHGVRDEAGRVSFAPWDGDATDATGWRIPDIFDTIERGFHGARAILMADACHSGALGVEASKRRAGVAYACLSSSLSREVSTGNWTFTSCVLDGVAGAARADADGDCVVTMEELAAYTESEMAFVEGQLSTFAAVGGFPRALSLARTGGARMARAGEHVEVREGVDDGWARAEIVETSGDRIRVRRVDGDEEGSETWSPPLDLRRPVLQRYAAGALVSVEWEGAWYPASVEAERLGVHLVHYDDYDDAWDEWVGIDRIKQR